MSEKMVSLNVSALRGRELGWVVAHVLGMEPFLMRNPDNSLVVIAHFSRGTHGGLGSFGPFDPASSWEQAGPLFQKFGITVGPSDDESPPALEGMAQSPRMRVTYGKDYLEAGIRHLALMRGSALADVPEVLVREAALAREYPRHPCGLPLRRVA